MRNLLPGDIFLTSSKSMISKLIKLVLWKINDPAPFSHVAGYVEHGQVIEAKHKVELNAVAELLGDKNNYMVVRMLNVTDEDRQAMADMARLSEGESYGYIKVGLLQLLDQIFHTNFFTEKFSVTNRPYCSELWARVYKDILDYKINGVEAKSCEPDDWQDEVLKNPNKWQIIERKKK